MSQTARNRSRRSRQKRPNRTSTSARRMARRLNDELIENQQRSANIPSLTRLPGEDAPGPLLSATTCERLRRRGYRRWAQRQVGRVAPWLIGVPLSIGLAFLIAHPGA
jgi:hypothetical protein